MKTKQNAYRYDNTIKVFVCLLSLGAGEGKRQLPTYRILWMKVQVQTLYHTDGFAKYFIECPLLINNQGNIIGYIPVWTLT